MTQTNPHVSKSMRRGAPGYFANLKTQSTLKEAEKAADLSLVFGYFENCEMQSTLQKPQRTQGTTQKYKAHS